MSSSNLNKKGKNKPDKGYRIVRLVNGEKLIAKISGSTSTKLVLNRPMTIRGMTTNNPLAGISKEFLVLTDWMEHCSDDNVRIKLDCVLTISSPDEFIEEAYDCQKEYEDTGSADPRMEDIPNSGSDNNNHKTLAELLEEAEDEEFTEDSLKEFLSDFVNSIVDKASSKLEEEWIDEEVDKERPDYGNELDDWSPYPEDYCD